MIWESDAIDELKLLWRSGHSASQIARRLGGGVTRNAVIGKVHRLGLSGRATPSRPVKRASNVRRLPSKPAPKISSVPLPPERPAPAAARRLSIADLRTGVCRFILNDDRASPIYCGADACGSWCAAHKAIIYQPRVGKVRRRVDAVERWALMEAA